MNNPYAAYRNATQTVAKTRQVVMLYDGIIRNLRQAQEAMEKSDHETRYNRLCKASEITVGLQMSLDFDSGGSAAQTLYDFYAYIDSFIMRLQRTSNAEQCAVLVEEVKQMRDVWDKIDRGEAGDSPAS
jgi:flagellar protein FliS